MLINDSQPIPPETPREHRPSWSILNDDHSLPAQSPRDPKSPWLNQSFQDTREQVINSSPQSRSDSRKRSRDETSEPSPPIKKQREDMNGASRLQLKPPPGKRGSEEISKIIVKKRRIQEKPIWAQKAPGRRRDRTPPRWSHNSSAQTAHRLPSPPESHVKTPSPSQTQSLQSPDSHVPLEPSFIGIIPADSITRKIADFLYEHAMVGLLEQYPDLTVQNVEIEAKLGRITDRDSGERLPLHVATETVLDPGDRRMKRPPPLRTSFRTIMTLEQHAFFNKYLNETARRPSAPSVTNGAPPPPPAKTYQHIRERDSFYEIPRAIAETLIPPSLHGPVLGERGDVKIRVTHDWHGSGTGVEKKCIIKRREADLEVFDPQTNFDWRVSVNVEYEYSGNRSVFHPVTENIRAAQVGGDWDSGRMQMDRMKDRMKYLHGNYDIDLTKVEVVPHEWEPGRAPSVHQETNFELELELSTERLWREFGLLKAGQANQYEDCVMGLVNSTRLLTRACRV